MPSTTASSCAPTPGGLPARRARRVRPRARAAHDRTRGPHFDTGKPQIDARNRVHATVEPNVLTGRSVRQGVSGRAAAASVHLAVGVPTDSPPESGSPSYSLLAATAPTYEGDTMAPGTATASAAAAFAGPATKVGLTLTIAMPDGSCEVETTGGAADPSMSELAMFENCFFGSFPITSAGGVGCAASSGTGATIRGFFAGPAGERIGIACVVNDTGDAFNGLRGAVLLTQ